VPLPLAALITVLSFAFTVGAFAGTVLGFLEGPGNTPRTSKKGKLLYVVVVTAFVALAVTAVALLWEQEQHSRHIQAASRKLVSVIGQRQKTADELLTELYPEDYETVSEALGLLVRSEAVGNALVSMKDELGANHGVRVYFLKQ
jgi:flagellar basal body-associated protein FliL